MALASSATVPGVAASIATPICASSRCVVRTSFSRATLSSTGGSSVNSDAHRIGSAAFFAPETRTSPSSRWPPSISSLSTLRDFPGRLLQRVPFGGRQGRHRQRVDLLAHALAERAVDELVRLHAREALELPAHDERLPVVTVARDLQVLAVDAGGDRFLDRFCGGHDGSCFFVGMGGAGSA